MEIRCERVLLRPWRRGDEAALVKHANNREVWRNLRDRFPHPYTMADADAWMGRFGAREGPITNFAIVFEGEPVGGIGLEKREDVDRRTLELGYWLGQPFWGRGLATEAARAVADYAFATFDVDRLEAGVFEWNPASGRVLEKAGFHLEARLKNAVFKDGRLMDRLLYARFRTGTGRASAEGATISQPTSAGRGAVWDLPTSTEPRVSVIIPSAARSELLEACLRSLVKHAPDRVPFETIVVLNNVTSQSEARIRQAFGGLRLIGSAVNLGLAGSGNLGRASAKGELLVLLHDDAEIEPGWMEALVETADRHPEAGAIGSKVLFPDGRLQSAGGIVWSDGTTSSPWIGPPPAPTAFDDRRAVDYCGTSSLLVRAATWDAVGGLDERFFPAYYVDVDLCMGVRRNGQVVLYEPRSRIRHHRGASMKNHFRVFVSARNRRLFLQKWAGSLVEHEPLAPGSSEAIGRALERARACASRARPAAAAFPSRALDTVTQMAALERRHLERDLALQRDYAADLTAAREAMERLRWWRLYVRLLPFFRRLTAFRRG